jgi:hypothetical protein
MCGLDSSSSWWWRQGLYENENGPSRPTVGGEITSWATTVSSHYFLSALGAYNDSVMEMIIFVSLILQTT